MTILPKGKEGEKQYKLSRRARREAEGKHTRYSRSKPEMTRAQILKRRK